ncbi:MAG: UDP-N-acetylmuramate dehydrogenase [Bacteroidales bacterium]
MQTERDKDLKRFNTLGLSVKCDWFAQPQSNEEVIAILKDPRFNSLPKLVTGSGSNILYNGDFKGLVIHPDIMEISITGKSSDHVYVRSGAGVDWDDLVEWCVDRGWGGLENLSLIPGCVGASPVQNIGAYGCEVKDTIESVEFVNMETFEVVTLSAGECRFGYRDSIFKHELKGKAIITYVTFSLTLNPLPNISYKDVNERLAQIKNPGISDVRNAIIAIRREKLPDPAITGNAGSFFKNPVIPETEALKLSLEYPSLKLFPASPSFSKIPAAWLIEQCGFKGIREGNVGVHPNQALVLVAFEGATGPEILALAQKIKRAVKTRFDIDIEMEVNVTASS